MTEPLTLRVLRDAMANRAAAFRCRRRLQPAAGPGTKVFPPTYAGATYAVELRRIDGESVPCVLIDSVQSQANRMEEALQQAVDDQRLKLPVVTVNFPPPGDGEDDLKFHVGRITSLQAPHRLADAILRDSQIDGKPFRQSDLGSHIDAASLQNATPLFELGPHTLVFGMWDSTGPRGGLGAKFERAIVSEIVGVRCPYLHNDEERREGLLPKNHGIRRDPLNVSKQALVRKAGDHSWTNVVEMDKKASKGAIRPSEINHGNVPFDGDNAGITIDYCEQTTTLSLVALRRLRFPDGDGQADTERDRAAQVVLAAMGLCATALAADEGLDLRSRCLLWPEEVMTWDLLAKPGTDPTQFELGADEAVKLLTEAIDAAKSAGLPWRDEPVELKPSAELVKLVARSQAFESQISSEEGD